MNGETFPGYQPKLSPDTIRDYIGTWANQTGKSPSDVLGKIPEARLENLVTIVGLLAKYKRAAEESPGRLVPGNMILGADREEYVPSEAELVASELGTSIMSIVRRAKPGEVTGMLTASKVKDKTISFLPITFRHSDVMGSGRFVYAQKGEIITIKL